MRETYNHLLVFRNLDPLSLNHLDELQPAKYLMLNHKVRLHAETSPFLNSERLVLESIDGARSSQVDNDVRTAFDFEGEGLDDTFALVVGIHCYGWGRREAEGGLPAIERLIFLIYILLC